MRKHIDTLKWRSWVRQALSSCAGSFSVVPHLWSGYVLRLLPSSEEALRRVVTLLSQNPSLFLSQLLWPGICHRAIRLILIHMNQSQCKFKWTTVFGWRSSETPLDLGTGSLSLQVHDYYAVGERVVGETIIITIINSRRKWKCVVLKGCLMKNGGSWFWKG